MLSYQPLEDDNEKNYLTSTRAIDSSYTEEEKGGKAKSEGETIVPTKDTNNTSAFFELFCDDNIPRNESDALTMKPTSGEIKSSQIAPTMDHQENEIKSPTLDSTTLDSTTIDATTIEQTILTPIDIEKILSEDLPTSFENEHYISLYDTLEFSFFDNELTEENETTTTTTRATKPTRALESITEEPRQECSSWMNAPSLTESESDEESVIDEDACMGERLLIDIAPPICNVTHNAQNTLTNDSKSTRILVSSVTPSSIRNERLLINMKLSSTLAYNRKEALIRKRKSLVQTRRQIRIIIRLILGACIVLITNHVFGKVPEKQILWTTVQPHRLKL